MALTPEEQAELAALQAELGPVQAKPGLTPEEEAELKALQAELGPSPAPMNVLRGIANVETRGQKDPYKAKAPTSSAVGKYQYVWCIS